MRVERVVVGELDTNCWIVGPQDGPVAVIDPAGEAERILEALGDSQVSAIVLTHGHFDHMGAAARVAESFGAPLMVHEADAAAVMDPMLNGGRFFGFDVRAPAPDRELSHGDVISVGEVELRVLHTPGHTPGGISLEAPGHVFCGDTVFAGSVGRTDFPGGDGRELRRSIENHIVPLPDDTVLHPGHGPDTTVGAERAHNPFFPRG